MFKGTGVALVTPFDEDLKLDLDAYANIVENAISKGVDFLVPLGSTGEAATLTEEESRKVLDLAIEVNKGRIPILAGNFGGNDTMALVRKIHDFDFRGIDGILSASPAYIKPSQEGIFQHYMSLAKASPRPIMIYNVPGRTASNIEWSTVIRLAEASDNFAGIKEASGLLDQATHILYNKPEAFILSSGDDPTALPFIAAGGDGVISVIANAYPDIFSEMTAAARNGDISKASSLNKMIFDLHKWLYIEGNPVGIKAAMQSLGFCKRYVRLPLSPMTEANYKLLDDCIKRISLR